MMVLLAGAISAQPSQLEVMRIHPSGEQVPSGRQVVVHFNQPVVPLGRMARLSSEVPATITPDPGCEWRWLSTSSLACQLGESNALAYATKYLVEVQAGFTSATGAVLREGVAEHFETERPKVRYHRFETWRSPGIPRARITFNQPVDAASVAPAVRFETAGGAARTWVLPPDDSAIGSGATEDGRTWWVEPVQPLDPGQEVRLTIHPGVRSLVGPLPGNEDRLLATFSTFPEPEFLGIDCRDYRGNRREWSPIASRPADVGDGSAGCDPLGGVGLVFSSPVTVESLAKSLEVTPPLAGDREDFDPWDGVYSYSRLGRASRRHRYAVPLPVGLAAMTQYRLRARAAEILDEFGRPLPRDIDFTFTTGHRRPRFVLDDPVSTLEEGVESHPTGVVTNLDGIEIDFRRRKPAGSWTKGSELFELPAVVDVAYRHPIPTRALLEGGEGAVVGRLLTTPSTTQGGRWFFSQVTSFQVHVKAGFHNSLVWVTDLASGEPVEGASVEVFLSSYASLDDGEVVAAAETDDSGLAHLPGTASLDPEHELTASWRHRDEQHLVVRVGAGESMALVPLADDFSVRGRGPNRSYLPTWRRQAHGHLVTWGFTAQGIYRAGDTVEYKIYVREEGNRTLESAPAGPYGLEVRDPAGKVVHRRADLELNEFGAFDGSFTLSRQGAVGWHSFELTAGFAADLGWTPLRMLVSDFVPAPFRVAVDLDRELVRDGETVALTTSAALHAGGPYVHAPTRITARLVPGRFRPEDPRATGFLFDTGSAESVALLQTELTLDGEGSASTEFTASSGEILYGRLQAESAVQDDRGKRVASSVEARFASRDRFVGISQSDWVLKTGTPASVDAWVADEHGNLLPDQEVAFTIEREVTHAARVRGAGSAYLTRYERSWETAAACSGLTTDEPASCSFSPPQAGRYRLTAAIADTRGRPVSSTLHRWTVGAGRVLWEEPPGHHLQIEAEASVLRVGETARYLVKNPFPGARALVTLERLGTIRSWTTTFESSSELIEFEVEPDLLPGFYLSVVVTSPRVAPAPPSEGGVDLGKPAFRLGYARTEVRDPYKELDVEVTPQDEVTKPRQRVRAEISVSTRQGETPPAEVAVAVLDEAVLDLLSAGEATFDPYVGLYRLAPLDVANYNLVKALVGWRKIEKKGADAGGGGGGDDRLRSIFDFVAYWNPAVETDSSGQATIEFDLPDNLTGWRVLAVAATRGDRVGLGSASFRTNLPTEVRPALPNQVIEGDAFEARFTVMNRTDSRRRLRISARATGAVDGAPAMETRIRAEPFQRYVVSLPITTTTPGEIGLEVRAGDRMDEDALTVHLPVLPAASLLTAADYGSLTGTSDTRTVAFPAEMRTDVGALEVTASPTVIGSLERAFTYLRDYPYSCWEQRLSKGAMAAYFLALRPYLSEEVEWPEAAADLKRTLERAADFQAPNGGMVYWLPLDQYASPYLSAYTALVFGWLEELGYEPPAAVEERLHEYLRTYLRKDVLPDFYSRGMSSTVRAVALAALAAADDLAPEDLERYAAHVDEMSLFGKAHYLLAAAGIGADSEERRRVVGAILDHAQESAGKIVFSEPLDDGYSRILHSELRTQCAVLSSILAELPGERVSQVAPRLVRHLTQSRRQRHRWENTQENLFCARALSAYAERFESVSPDMKARASIGGAQFGEGSWSDFRDPALTFSRPITVRDPGTEAAVTVEREGAGRLYYSVRLAWAPADPGQRTHNAGFDVRREYSVEREGGWELLDSPALLRQGELVRVDLYVSLPAARNFVVVEDPVPGGLEPVQRELATSSTIDADKERTGMPPNAFFFTRDDWRWFGWTRWSFYHRELRHDAVRFYSEYLPAGSYHLSYVAQAIAPGSFRALPVRAEEMYDPDVFGAGLSRPFEIEALP